MIKRLNASYLHIIYLPSALATLQLACVLLAPKIQQQQLYLAIYTNLTKVMFLHKCYNLQR